jgi:hypothetical protein
VAGGDVNVAQVDAGVEHGGDVGVAEHVRVDRRHPHPGCLGQGAKPAGRSVPVHPGAASVEQDRSGDPLTDRLIESSADGRRQWDEDGLAAFAEDPEDAMAVFLTKVGNVQAGGFEDPMRWPASTSPGAKEASCPAQRQVSPWSSPVRRRQREQAR